MTKWKADAKCPHCGREPNVRFSEREVRRCRVDRASARHTEVQCPRCRRKFWIRSGQIAAASTNGRASTNGHLPEDFPWRGKLVDLGIESLTDLQEVEDLTQLPGFGDTRAGQVNKALDALKSSA